MTARSACALLVLSVLAAVAADCPGASFLPVLYSDADGLVIRGGSYPHGLLEGEDYTFDVLDAQLQFTGNYSNPELWIFLQLPGTNYMWIFDQDNSDWERIYFDGSGGLTMQEASDLYPAGPLGSHPAGDPLTITVMEDDPLEGLDGIEIEIKAYFYDNTGQMQLATFDVREIHTPEPATLVLLGIGGAMLSRRKARRRAR